MKSLSDYLHMVRDTAVITVTMTADEMAAILSVYDYGTGNMSADTRRELDIVIAKLKEQIWP